MTRRFNPPPNWPEPPTPGWVPPDGWKPDPSWGPVPAGWRLWVGDSPAVTGQDPVLRSEAVPASGARVRARVVTYPRDVLNPGMLTDNPLEDEDFGFPPAKQRRDRPRLRLALTIVVTVIGFLIAAATVLVFLGIHDYAISSLSSALGVGTSATEVSGAFPGTGSVGTRGATAS